MLRHLITVCLVPHICPGLPLNEECRAVVLILRPPRPPEKCVSFLGVLIALTTQFHTIAPIHSCQILLLLSKLEQQSRSSRTLQSRRPSSEGY